MRLFICLAVVWVMTSLFPDRPPPVMTIVAMVIAMVVAGQQDFRELKR